MNITTVNNPLVTEEVVFNVNVSCSQDDLQITWQAVQNGNYHASVNSVCTDTHGINVSHTSYSKNKLTLDLNYCRRTDSFKLLQLRMVLMVLLEHIYHLIK